MAEPPPDLQRLGLFREMTYISIGEPYHPPGKFGHLTRTKPSGSPHMYLAGGYSKKKAGNVDGYFAEFDTINIGDGGMNIGDIMRQTRKVEKTKRIGKGEWIPSGPAALRAGTGSGYGNFQESFTAFDPARNIAPRVKQPKNFYTNPGKKGTGYGYLDVCINPFPTWQPDDNPVAIAKRIFQTETADHLVKLKNRKPFISMCRSMDPFDENPWSEGDPLAPGGSAAVQLGVGAFPKSMRLGPIFVPSHPARLDGGMKDGALSAFPDYAPEPYIDPYRMQRPTDKSKFLAGQWTPNPETALVMPQPSIVDKNTMFRLNTTTRKHLLKVWDAC